MLKTLIYDARTVPCRKRPIQYGITDICQGLRVFGSEMSDDSSGRERIFVGPSIYPHSEFSNRAVVYKPEHFFELCFEVTAALDDSAKTRSCIGQTTSHARVLLTRLEQYGEMEISVKVLSFALAYVSYLKNRF
jgi:hypothetical protein